MTSNLKYVLDCLRRSADSSDCWPVYPAEAGALVAEFDRLLKENEDLRKERPSVVTWLEELSASSLHHDPVEELLFASRSIERGEHRREEEK